MTFIDELLSSNLAYLLTKLGLKSTLPLAEEFHIISSGRRTYNSGRK